MSFKIKWDDVWVHLVSNIFTPSDIAHLYVQPFPLHGLIWGLVVLRSEVEASKPLFSSPLYM